VGAGTLLDYVEMREGYFGCLFAEGGAFYARHLVCQHGGNTGFGFTRGNKSRVQFAIDQEDPAQEAEGIGIKGPFGGNQLVPLTEPTIYNATLCGAHGPSPKDPYGVFMNRRPSGAVYDSIATAFFAGVAMRGGINQQGVVEAAHTEIRSTIFFGNADPNTPNTNIGYGRPTDDVDVNTWFLTAGWNNSTSDPGLGNCWDAKTFHMSPAASLTTNAAIPSDPDGFFDTTAAFIGALRDKNDTWPSGAWFVWSDQ
jgi:hypothetical protein